MSITVALVVGAGRGRRFGGAIPKQYCDLDGEPVLKKTLTQFLKHPLVDAVCCVISPDDSDLYDKATVGLNLLAPVLGGARRQDSVKNGLEALADRALDVSKVLIHDAARPFVANDTITAVIEALGNNEGVIPALAMTDTVKQTDTAGSIVRTIPRNGLWRAQTPQGFRFQTILEAHRQMADADELTDDAALLEALGRACKVIEGKAENVKITTQEDLAQKAQPKAQPIEETRMGLGFDVHQLIIGDGVTICGIKIPHSHSLKGHSDADVGMHALTDAILGAIGQGDIGTHFPPSDPQWKGVASKVFLKKAAELVRDAGARFVNMDVTIICEQPKIGPHRAAMQKYLAEVLEIELNRISIKATTTECLGFTGRSEGIAAQAIAAVAYPCP